MKRQAGYTKAAAAVTPATLEDFMARIYPALCRTAQCRRTGVRRGLPGLRGSDWMAEIIGMGWIFYLTDLARGITPSPGAIAWTARRRVCSGGRVCHPAQARYKKAVVDLQFMPPMALGQIAG